MNAEEPLLTGSLDHERYDAITQHPSKGQLGYEVTIKSESKFILKSVGPLAVTFFLQSLLSITTIFAAGRLGPRELSAATLAVCTFNITGLAVYQGMATCLDSFCSQAYGAQKPLHVGMYFQRCSLMMLVFTVFPLSFIWWYSGSFLKKLIPDEELAMMAQSYLRINIIGAPGLLLFETGKRYLQAQHIFNAGTYVLLIVAPLNFLFNWLLVWHPVTGLGFIGAPIAVSIIYWLTSILLLCYVLFIDGKKCWGGIDFVKSCQNWHPMLKLALPGLIMVEAEYLAFEILTIFAASFGTNQLAAQSIAANVGSLAFQLPFAAAVAISTRIGHFVGMEDIHAAKLVTRISFGLGYLLALFNFCVVFFGRRFLGTLLTSSEEVLVISDHILTLVAINQVSDNVNVMCAGVLRGQGRQRIGSLLNLVSYYVVALPVGYYLAFCANFQLSGLWVGIISGVFTLAVSETVSIIKCNWVQVLIDTKASHDH
ncbi:ethionine resistance-conferring protein 1 [[Candida] anglica]|uniref:Ethionine resistance-conferring protein 1 n=1 Tax=[Candida] anglica TaxID=148631 RepID=A0ABP0EGI8_9ASCO